MGDQQSSDKRTPQSFIHDFRKEIDVCIQKAEGILNIPVSYGREMALVRTKLQEAKMWAGKCLEVLGSELPKEFQDKAE